MIQISINDLLLFSVPLGVLLAFVGWLFKEWIGARIDKSIQHEYNIQLEKYKFQQLQRQKAEVVAKLFARWMKYLGKEGKYLKEGELIDYYEELNQMSLELSLWIHDKNILDGIMQRFAQGANPGKAKDVRTLTGEIRKMILANRGDDFDPQNIVLWDNKINDIVNS